MSLKKKKELNQADIYKLLGLIMSGFITLFFQQFIPIGSGGISLIFVLSVPFLILLSIIFAIIQYFLIKREYNPMLINIQFIIFTLILIGLALIWYPFK